MTLDFMVLWYRKSTERPLTEMVVAPSPDESSSASVPGIYASSLSLTRLTRSLILSNVKWWGFSLSLLNVGWLSLHLVSNP